MYTQAQIKKRVRLLFVILILFTAPKSVKSEAHTQFLVRFHRFCPLITMGGSKILWSNPGSWNRWTSWTLQSSGGFLTWRHNLFSYFESSRAKYEFQGDDLKFRALCIDYKRSRCKKSTITTRNPGATKRPTSLLIPPTGVTPSTDISTVPSCRGVKNGRTVLGRLHVPYFFPIWTLCWAEFPQQTYVVIGK